MLLDYHVHPDYSIDARGSMRDYAQKALEKGLSEICFTTHLDLVPERMHLDGYVRVNGELWSVKDEWIPLYLQEIHDMKHMYRGKGLEILAGVEMDYHPDVVSDIESILNRYTFDYVLGAVHSLDGYSIAVPEDCRAFCRGKTPQEVCRQYFLLVAEAVETELFDAMAHLDLYKRFSYSLYGPQLDDAHLPVWERVLEAFASSSVGVEINTGNWRKGLSQPSPSADQLADLVRNGLECVTVGSDAHLPALIGKDIQRALDFAQAAGCASVQRFRKRKPETAVVFSHNHTAAE